MAQFVGLVMLAIMPVPIQAHAHPDHLAIGRALAVVVAAKPIRQVDVDRALYPARQPGAQYFHTRQSVDIQAGAPHIHKPIGRGRRQPLRREGRRDIEIGREVPHKVV